MLHLDEPAERADDLSSVLLAVVVPFGADDRIAPLEADAVGVVRDRGGSFHASPPRLRKVRSQFSR
jgi:hypothetical protein